MRLGGFWGVSARKRSASRVSLLTTRVARLYISPACSLLGLGSDVADER